MRVQSRYRIDVRLANGWNGSAVVPSCPVQSWQLLPPEQKKVYIKCAPAFKPNPDNKCMPMKDTFSAKCDQATVTVKLPDAPHGTVLVKRIAVAKIGTSAQLSVALARAQDLDLLWYRFVPLKHIQERRVGEDLAVVKTGKFGVELLDNSTNRSCMLVSKLEVKCGSGFKEDNHNKCAPGMWLR